MFVLHRKNTASLFTGNLIVKGLLFKRKRGEPQHKTADALCLHIAALALAVMLQIHLNSRNPLAWSEVARDPFGEKEH